MVNQKKRRIYKRYRTKKRGGQHYYIGRKIKINLSSKGWFTEPSYTKLKQQIKNETNINIINRELEPSVRQSTKLTDEQTRELESLIFDRVELLTRKKNYGGGPLFGKILQEQGIIITGSPKEKRIMRKLFERSPELIKDIPKDTIVGFGDLPENVLGIYSQPPANIRREIGLTKRFIPQTNPLLEEIQKTHPKARPQPTIKQTPEMVLRHEVEHARLPIEHTIPKMREMASRGELGDIFSKEEQYNLLYEPLIPSPTISKFREYLARQEQSKTPVRQISSEIRLWPPPDDKPIRRIKIPEERIIKSLNRILP